MIKFLQISAIILPIALIGCGGDSPKNSTTSSKPKNNQVNPTKSTLNQKLSQVDLQSKKLSSEGVDAIMNLPVGKTSLSISTPTKFSQVKQ
ncbi:hypothetical protein AB4407_06220 [Vibrio sp. 10N.261.46.E11]|uniref:hypothetical protein n=1 Tax=Vibrio sp. 10N.261.46.E11 TaxID=3229662 RepID=UPI00354D6193